jgi:hypothetical protein
VDAAHLADGQRADVVDVALHDPVEAVVDADDVEAGQDGADRRRADDRVDARRGAAAHENADLLRLVEHARPLPPARARGYVPAVSLPRVIGFVVLLVGSACGGGTPAPEGPPPPKPRDATEIAVKLVGGKVTLLAWPAKVRGTPLAHKLAALEPLRPLLDGTGLDAERDVDRAFATMPAVRAAERVLGFEHALPEARVRAAVDVLVAKSKPSGAWVDGLGVPAALVTVHGERAVVALPTPTLVVVLPEARAKDAARFAQSGGVPDPEGGEAAVATAIDPATTLQAPHAPAVPRSIAAARAVITPGKDGGADVAFDAQSASAQQAVVDAGSLTRSVDDATTLRVSILTVRVMAPVTFRAEGDHVKSDVHLAPADVDRLLGLASAAVR